MIIGVKMDPRFCGDDKLQKGMTANYIIVSP